MTVTVFMSASRVLLKLILPNSIILFSLLILLFPSYGWTTTYFMRADGTAIDKISATGPCDRVDGAMSVTTHNNQTFKPRDVICLCDDGGAFKSSIVVPSSGVEGNSIVYKNAPDSSPVIDLSTDIGNSGWIQDHEGVFRKRGAARLFFEDGHPLEAATTKACSDGNWYYRLGSNILYYKPKIGSPADHGIETLWFKNIFSQRGLDLSNKSNIEVSGLTFDRCGVGIYFGQDLDSPVSPMRHIFIHDNGFSRVHWGILSQITANGIESQIKIADNYLSYVSCGISAWTRSDQTPGHTQHHGDYQISGNKILNLNHISDSLLWTQAWKPGHALDHEGISFQDVQNSEISNNIITTKVLDTNDRLRAIYLFLTANSKATTSGNKITRNRIEGVFRPAIYISAALGNAGFENNTIAYNLIYSRSPDKSYVSFKINTYSGTNPLSGANYFVNNVIDNFNGEFGIAARGAHGSGSWIVRNNIIKSRGYISLSIASASGFTIDHNIYPADDGWHWLYGKRGLNLSGWQSKGGFDKVGSMIVDPVFCSISDFHLQASSPAIDAGINVGIKSDLDGNSVPCGSAPDIGVYEYTK